MLDGVFSSKTYLTLKKMLDYSALKQKVVANNVANVNTPGFKRSDVSFPEELTSLLEDGDKEQISNLDLKVYQPDNLPLRNDGNNVDIDKEMSTLAKNSFMFAMYSQMVSGKLGKIKEAINLSRT